MSMNRTRALALAAALAGAAIPTATALASIVPSSTPTSTTPATASFLPHFNRCELTGAGGLVGTSATDGNQAFITVPATATPGQRLSFAGSGLLFSARDLRSFIQVAGAKSLRVTDGSVSFDFTGAAPASATASGTLPSSQGSKPLTTDAAGSVDFSFTLGDLSPAVSVTAASGSVSVQATKVTFHADFFGTSDGSGPSTPYTITCTQRSGAESTSIPVVPGSTPATTPVAPTTPKAPATTPVAPGSTPTTPVAPAAAPSVGQVLGQGYGFVGGLIVVAGSRFDGYTGLTVGGKKAITLGRIGNLVIAIAPAQAPGTYPVVVTTKSGLSPAAAAAAYKYTSIF